MEKLHVQAIPGHELSVELLQTMSRLRRSIMTMKPDVDLAADFDNFCAFCRASFRTCLFFNTRQELVGMYAFIVRHERTEQGQRYMLVIPEYAFMQADYRANPALPRSVLWMMPPILRHWRGEPIWLGGIGYPSTVLTVHKLSGNLFFHSDPDLSPLQIKLFDIVTREIGGEKWDAEKGYNLMPTTPPAMPQYWHQQAQSNPVYLRYMALCPNWPEGKALPILSHLHPMTILRRSLMKMWRRAFNRYPSSKPSA